MGSVAGKWPGRLSRLFVLITIVFLAVVMTWLVLAGGVQAAMKPEALMQTASLPRTAPGGSLYIEFYYSGNDSSSASAAADNFAALLSVETGHDIHASMVSCEGLIIDHLGLGTADIAVLSGLGYAFGHNKYGIEARLVNGMSGGYYYRGQINVLAASGYNDLWDLQGSHFAATDPDSISGYMFPYLLISETTGMAPEEFFSEISFVGDHKQVIREVYTGAMECGATYEDARYAMVGEYPDVFSKVSVLTYTEDIYRDPWVFRQGLDASVVQAVTDGMIAVAGTTSGENDLKIIFGNSLTGIGVVDDSAYEPFLDLIAALDLRLDPCYRNYMPVMVRR